MNIANWPEVGGSIFFNRGGDAGAELESEGRSSPEIGVEQNIIFS